MSFPSQLSPAAAATLLRQHARLLGTETVPLAQATGRILAADLAAKVAHPSCDNAQLDGYACRAADCREASAAHPVRLICIGDVPAGQVFAGEVQRGECVSIYTGSPMPAGADAVIGVEDTARDGEHILLKKPASKAYVRKQAQDLAAGEVALTAGRRLDSASIAVAAVMGHALLRLRLRPRVGILVTGDEVVEPGSPIRKGQVYNANGYGLAARLQELGATPVLLPNVADDLEALAQRVQRQELDLLLTSGGVSMGKYDFVRDLLFARGEVYFWKLAIRPGGPTLFGSYQGVPVLGLPGNPVSSLVVFELFGRVFLNALTGCDAPPPLERPLRAVAGSPFKDSGFKTTYARASLSQDAAGRWVAKSTGNQNSGVLRSVLLADALAVVPPHAPLAVGDALELIVLA